MRSPSRAMAVILGATVLLMTVSGVHAQTSAAAVLQHCGITLTPRATNSTNSLPGYPQVLAWASSYTLPVPTVGQAYALYWVGATDCVSYSAARSYTSATAEGPIWEGTRPYPVQPTCAGTSCTINTQTAPVLTPGVGAFILDGFSRNTGAISNAEAASRFLVQGTFGPKQSEVTSLLGARAATDPYTDGDTVHFRTWLASQIALPPTLLRSHFRQRVNTRMRGGIEAVVGRLSQPCDIGSRWHRYAFNTNDLSSVLTVTRNGATQGTCYYSLSIAGVKITDVMATFDQENCTSASPSLRTYRICSVTEKASYSGSPNLGLNGPAASPAECTVTTGRRAVPLPMILIQGSANLNTTQVYNAGQVNLSSVEAVSDTVIISAISGTCVPTRSRSRLAFMSVSGVYYRLDTRRQFVRNTLQSPAFIPDPAWAVACPVVKRNPLNEDTCVLRTAGSSCVTTTYNDGVSLVLNSNTLQRWYTNDQRYVYSVRNLRIDASLHPAPCTAFARTRWIRAPGACAAGASTEQVVINAISGSTDPNPDVRDIIVSDIGTCGTTVPRGAFVNVAGSCWTHTHPKERSVYDFSQWQVDHDGGPVAIAKWAIAGSTTLNFPASHPMVRFYDEFERQQNGGHPELGRENDQIEFTSLPDALQTEAMASFVGATGTVTSTGFLSCGSRGEEANDPTLGNRYIGDDPYGGKALALDNVFTFNNFMGSAYVWHTVALTAPDQLRQRVAWALAQWVVAAGDDGFLANEEPLTAFYDIFIQHAFGNYRDVLREISMNPVMGRYLTFQANRAFAVTSNFPDENYAREIMQLFSIGVFQLDAGGLPIQNPITGEFQITYTNTDIENGARVWTGWRNKPMRQNLVKTTRTMPNWVDPMSVTVSERDRFPKTRVGGGYLGDGYPLCAELPDQHFLKQGAKYVLTGEMSDLGEFYDNIASLPGSKARDHFTLTSSSTSNLYQALCSPSLGNCQFPSSVRLATNLACVTSTECNADTLRVVKVVSQNNGIAAYYKYIEPSCTYMSFFDGGRIAKSQGSEQCADPLLAISIGATCCRNDIVVSNSGAACEYLAEPMTYATALARCQALGVNVTVCSPRASSVNNLVPLRDGYNAAAVPRIPNGVILRKAGPVIENGVFGGVTRWRMPINLTTVDTTGTTMPVRLEATLPDNSKQYFNIDRVVGFASAGNQFLFRPIMTQAEYQVQGPALLAAFNALPTNTIFTLQSFALGPDPTGELGTADLWNQTCAAWQYQWTTDSCQMTVEIDKEGLVSLVDSRGQLGSARNRLLREGSGNKFTVQWNTPRGQVAAGETFPRLAAPNGGCNATLGCTQRGTSDSCICSVTAEHVAMFTSPAGPFGSPSELRSKLFIGSVAPTTLAGYVRCTSCTTATNVQVWTRGSATPASLDQDAIFVLTDLPFGMRDTASYLRNRVSTVLLGSAKIFNFRNAPQFVPNAGSYSRTAPDSSPRYEVYASDSYAEKAVQETEALIDRLVEHPNTPTMVALQLIQKFVSSNPSPRYVERVATAFKTGTVPGMSFSGKHGDLGATIAAVLLDREARTPLLDVDPNHGRLNEPVLKILHMMRSMEYQSKPGFEIMLQNLGVSIGQGPFQHPSVFSFFSPFYNPPGMVSDAALVSPEAQILNPPLLVAYLNGMDSLVEYGLTRCGVVTTDGFGDSSSLASKRNNCNPTTKAQSSDGVFTYALPSTFSDVEYIPTGVCTASTMPANSSADGCNRAIDDNMATAWRTNSGGVGAWIKLEFGTSVAITAFRFANRCGLSNKDIQLQFSTGSPQNFTLPDDCILQNFTLSPPVAATTFVRVVVLSVHNFTTSSDNGAREIEFLNSGALVSASACSVSNDRSQPRTNTCNSLGNTLLPGWSWQSSGVSSWIQQDLGQSRTIGRVQFADRCSVQRPQSVQLEFSDGSMQTITVQNSCFPIPVPIRPVATTFVKATVLSVYTPGTCVSCSCGRPIRRIASSVTTSTCEEFRAGAAAEFRFYSPRDKGAIVDTLATLLAPGRLSDVERSIIGDAYEQQGTQDQAFKYALKLFMMTPAFHVTNDPSPLLRDRPSLPAVTSLNRPYKAVITILLEGGADSFNMLVPSTCTTNLYGEYATIRGADLALPQASLLTVAVGPDSKPQPCSAFGLHPSLQYLQRAYTDKDAIIFANTGAMAEPIASYDEFRTGLYKQPTGNFAHNGMQRNVQSLDATDHLANGVLGRIMGVMSTIAEPFKGALYSLASQMKILEGSLTPSIVQAGSGVIRYTNLLQVRAAIDELNLREQGSIFAETYSSSLEQSIDVTENLGSLLSGTNLTLEGTAGSYASYRTLGGSLGQSLAEVAKLIKIDDNNLEVERAGFIVRQGGYDTHDSFDISPLMNQLDASLRLFSDEMKAQGLWENVAIVVTSDFGRTLTSNTQGTDHAWGGNYFMLGGNVRGGRMLGTFPDSLAEGNSLDMGRGRIIPTTPWESIWYGVAQWFGVPETEMAYVLPNKDAFPASWLFPQEELFDVLPSQTTVGGGTGATGTPGTPGESPNVVSRGVASFRPEVALGLSLVLTALLALL